MKRIQVMFAVAVCSLGVMSMGAFAQDKQPDKKPADAGKQPAHPAKADPKAAAPAGMPSQDDMMKAMMEAATPGPQHELLLKGVGEWAGKVTMYNPMDGTATTSTCTTLCTPMMEGRFVKCETKGMMEMGGGMPPMSFEGFGVYGYNNTTKTFESTWIDNMGTMTMHLTGKASSDGKTMEWTSEEYMCPIMHQLTTMREVERTTGENTKVMEMYAPGPDGKEMKVMQIDYTRKPGQGKVIGESKGEIKKADPKKN